jgi:quercetin dioxygenase-like cupin family protein
MKVSRYADSKPTGEIEGVSRRDVLSAADGVTHFTMSVTEITTHASTPTHHHPWEHEIFIMAGKGIVVGEKGGSPIAEGTVVFIPANETHCFVNTGDETLRYISVEPVKEKGQQ